MRAEGVAELWTWIALVIGYALSVCSLARQRRHTSQGRHRHTRPPLIEPLGGDGRHAHRADVYVLVK